MTVDAAVRVTFHPVDDALRRHLSARYWRWLELFEHDPEARIAQHPEYIFVDSPASSDPSNPVWLCEATRGDQLIGLGILVPRSYTWRQAGGIGIGKTLSGYRLAGHRFLGMNDRDVLQRMLTGCEDFCLHQRRFFLLLEELDEESPVCEAARSIAYLGTSLLCLTNWQPHWRIKVPPKPEDYWGKFSGKTRYNFRRRAKLLGNTRYVKVTEPEQVADFLEAAHYISLRSWQTQQLGLRIRNDEFELNFYTSLASQQALRAYLLYVDDKPAAFLIGTQFRGYFIDEEVGFDHSLTERGPGLVLLNHVLDDILRNDPPTQFDFGIGDAEYKQLYGNHESVGATVWIVPGSWRHTPWLMLLRFCRATKSAARRIVAKLGLTTLARQLIRGKRTRITAKNSRGETTEAGEAT